jgi:hypothetical protein
LPFKSRFGPTKNVRSVDFVHSTVNLTTSVRLRIALRLARLLIASLTMACPTAAAAQSKAIAVTNVTLVDGTGAKARKVLPRLLAYGITGVRDMASPLDDILRLRRETAGGTVLGPQIVAAGPILQRPLPFRPPPLVRTVTDADARQVVDDLQAKGVD